MPATSNRAIATTMAPYFARAMVAEAKWLIAAGVKPDELNRGIDFAVAAAVAEFDKEAGSTGQDARDRGLCEIVADAIAASAAQGGLAVDRRGGGNGETEKLCASIDRFADAAPGTIAAQKQRRVANMLRALSSVHARLRNLHGATVGEEAGIRVVLNALDEPLRELLRHAEEDPGVVLERVLEGIGNFGVNPRTGEYGDLGAMGILDWQGAVHSGLQSAASVAEAILSASYAAAPKPGRVTMPPRKAPPKRRR